MPATDPFRELFNRVTRASRAASRLGRSWAAPESVSRRAQTAGIAGLLIALATLRRLRAGQDEDRGERRPLRPGPDADS